VRKPLEPAPGPGPAPEDEPEGARGAAEEPEQIAEPAVAAGASEDVTRGAAEGAEKIGEEPVAAAAPELAAPEEDAVTSAEEETETLGTVSLLAMAPPPPRGAYLAETARRLIAEATTEQPSAAPPCETADGRAFSPHGVTDAATQVAISQEDMTTNLADKNAPKEIRFSTAGAPGGGPMPLASGPLAVPDPPGGAGVEPAVLGKLDGCEVGGRDPTGK
jgi:hypothetical protein